MSTRSVTAGVVAAIVVLLFVTTPAFAHRLDEYLQATTIRLAKGHLTVNLRLTPGVQVYPTVVADIDADHDGVISDAEGRAYAERVRRDLSLTVDGTPTPLRLASSDFPTVEAMSGGVGDIRLTFEADVPAGGPAHRVVFDNGFHQGGAAAYLVNCLVPADPDLRVTGQDRSHDQSHYELTYTQAATADPATQPADPPSWMDRNGGGSLVGAYLFHGVRHILTGYDHLLFVSALVLAATTLWDLVKVVTSFTVAHTITLTLAALGWVHLSDRIVEPLISASIVFVALQNVFWPRTARGWSRLGAAFFFGLFHGLGFAGGLLDAMREMPGGTMFLAIAAFSVGVEAGHQMVVLPLFAILKAARSTQQDVVRRAWLSMVVQRVGSACISLAGGYYLYIALDGTV